MKHTIELNEEEEARKDKLGVTYKELVLKGLLFMERQPQLLERIHKIENTINYLSKKVDKLEFGFVNLHKQTIDALTETLK